MEILESFSDSLDYDVTTDLKKYVAQRYKVRIVEEEEDGGSVNLAQAPAVENKSIPLLTPVSQNDPMMEGDSTQTGAIEPTENKNIPLLTALVQNDQMTESRGNASTNINTIVPEEDGYGTFISYRDRMVEPKKENDVLVGNNISVIHSIEVNQLDTNSEERDTVEEQPANECDINPPETVPQIEDIAHNELVLTDVADNTDIPLFTHSYSDNGNIENDLHTDDVGQDTLCFDIVVSDVLLTNSTTNSGAPVAVRRSTRSMKRGREMIEDGDEEEDTQKKNTKKSSLDDGPSTSTVRRSGRGVKRPAYSIDDEDSDEEDDGPVPTKAKSESKKPEQKGKDEYMKTGIECNKCMKQLNPKYRRYSVAKEHAITHTDIMRYECPVDGCGFKCGPSPNFDAHTRRKHGRHLSAKNIHLTNEQEEELNQMVKECFLDFETTTHKTCTVCQEAVLNKSIDQHHLRRHSLQHIEFMIYKCNQANCKYESKHFKYMIEHGRKKHKIEEMSKEKTEIELTDGQKKEINDMFEKCFSTNEINNTVTPGIECKKCSKKLSFKCYSAAKNHAVIHTDLKRFECPVDGCGFKCGLRQSICQHMRIKHSNCRLSTRKIDLTDEQDEELDQMTKECFPVFGTEDVYKACTICQTAISNNSLSQRFPKHHALQHVDFMLYKCNQANCHYEAKHYNHMAVHLRNKHGIEEMSREETLLKLTDDQKKEIDDMFKKCFPDEDVEEE